MNAERKESKLENVQDLVDMVMHWASIQSSRTSTRWSLEDNTTWVFDDEFAGKQWEHDEEVFQSSRPEKYWSSGMDSNVRKEWQAKVRAWELANPTPPKHRVVHYSLREQGQGYHSDYIQLGDELGQMLDSVWNKEKKYGSVYRRGGLTLGGMAKRLGNKDLSGDVKKAMDLAKRKDEATHRNYQRRQVREQAQKLWDAFKHAGEQGVDLKQFTAGDLVILNKFMLLADEDLPVE